MSAHDQARRSTSRTAPPNTNGIAQRHGATVTSTTQSPDPSSEASPAHHSALSQAIAAGDQDAPIMASTVLTAVPVANMIPADASATGASTAGFDDIPDNGSSSLSELGDASDDQSEPTPRPATALDVDDDDDDDDSEAETERLENTPKKLTRAGTDTSLASEPLYTRTPSKLAHSKTIEQDDSAPPTPSVITDDATLEEGVDETNPLHSLSLVAASEAATLEHVGRKRKRPSAEASPVDDQDEEPARKRSGTARPLNGDADNADADVEEELDNAEERLSQLAQEEMELEEKQATLAAETVEELATVAKHTKPRKVGRRGKRKADDTSHAYAEQLAALEAQEGEEEEQDEEPSAAQDEEVAKKRNAIDELAKIEKKFKVFREKLCDEQMAQLDRELEMLKQPNCTHPEYLAMVRGIDERRAEKIAYETRLLEYKQNNLEIITEAERHQMHSQYFQSVRHFREQILEECNQRVVELQRGRRSLGCDETEYMVKLPEKRSDQIRQQTAYNLEVSILSGVAKYVGFPAAPDISAARPSDIEDDLRAMKIATRPAPPPSFRTYNRTTTADEAAAEEQFLESTPWANPRHPSHQEARYGTGSRVPSYSTPAGQRRVVDLTAPNGSASTIEALSNPPSSNPHHPSGRIGESESPVMHMKRAPTDQPAYSETPGSHPRNMGVMGREPYNMLSSPAPPQLDGQADDHIGQRWGAGGIRPLHTAQSPATSAQPVTGRTEPSRAPLTQRSGFGAVIVGNGLFGR